MRFEVEKDKWRTYLVEEIEGVNVKLVGIDEYVSIENVHRASFALDRNRISGRKK